MLKFLAVALVIALAGCTEGTAREAEETSILASEVPIDGNREKIANCRETAVLSYTTGSSDKGGRIDVQIKDGNGKLVGQETLSPGQTDEIDLVGVPGKWLLRVDRDATFDGTFKVTLTC